MPEQASNKGLLVFGILIGLVLAGSLAAYLVSGDKGIEERFLEAVGLESGHEHDHEEEHAGEAGHEEAHDHEHEHGGGLFGFSIEGDIVSYAIVLAALVVASALLYLKFRS